MKIILQYIFIIELRKLHNKSNFFVNYSNKKCRSQYTTPCQNHLESISSTLYVQIFRTNIVFSSYMNVEKRRTYGKFVCITLMKLTPAETNGIVRIWFVLKVADLVLLKKKWIWISKMRFFFQQQMFYFVFFSFNIPNLFHTLFFMHK